MPIIKVKQDASAAKAHAREFALLRQLDSTGVGFDSNLLDKYLDHGDKEKIQALKGKSEIQFEEFAEAFKTKGMPLENKGNCLGWATHDDKGQLVPFVFSRRKLHPDDVLLQITYCGMCHSDLHQIKNEWGNSMFPMVPGHELMGVIVDIGKRVSKFKVGDLAAIGCMVDSCGSCTNCKKHEEQYCSKGMVGTYNSKGYDGEVNHGGYSTYMICKESFVLKLKPNMHKPGTAPLLCAGITTYSPMKHFGIDKPGLRIGVLGCGGLGHMAVKFGKAFGQHVTVISRSEKKKELATKELGADALIASSNEEDLKKAAGSLDAVIDTVSAKHDLNQMLSLLKTDGKLVCVGVPPEPVPVRLPGILYSRLSICGSLIGGVKETQEMLDFCAEKNIFCTCEVISADYVNEAFKRMQDGDVHFRFVIDTLKTLVQG